MVSDPEELCHLACLVVHGRFGRIPLFPHGNNHETQQHRVGDAQNGVNEAGNVVVPLAHLDGHQALHQEEPANRNQNEQTYQQDAGEYVNGEPPLLTYRLLHEVQDTLAALRGQSLLSRNAPLTPPYRWSVAHFNRSAPPLVSKALNLSSSRFVFWELHRVTELPETIRVGQR